MIPSNLDRTHEGSSLSMIGGAAQGGSAKPKEEREETDRKNQLEREGGTAEVGESTRMGPVGGNTNDNRTDPRSEEERRRDASRS